MKEFNLEEYNKMCAEFLGFKNCLIGNGKGGLYDYHLPNNFELIEEVETSIEHVQCWVLERQSFCMIKDLKFHSDWNWIMEVVERIENIADWELECFNTTDDDGNEIRLYQMRISISGTYSDNTDKKQAVVQAIWQFLNWYKEKGGKK